MAWPVTGKPAGWHMKKNRRAEPEIRRGCLQDSGTGGFYGLLIGDTLGVSYEFYKADQLPKELSLDSFHGYSPRERGVYFIPFTRVSCRKISAALG